MLYSPLHPDLNYRISVLIHATLLCMKTEVCDLLDHLFQNLRLSTEGFLSLQRSQIWWVFGSIL
ncbi:hypothetical protein [Prevotella histicola]